MIVRNQFGSAVAEKHGNPVHAHPFRLMGWRFWMPPLISFMITRLALGFSLGSVTGVVVWVNNISQLLTPNPEDWVAQGVFIFLFGSSIAAGYLATSLFLDVD